jgi:hypothetical protein
MVRATATASRQASGHAYETRSTRVGFVFDASACSTLIPRHRRRPVRHHRDTHCPSLGSYRSTAGQSIAPLAAVVTGPVTIWRERSCGARHSSPGIGVDTASAVPDSARFGQGNRSSVCTDPCYGAQLGCREVGARSETIPMQRSIARGLAAGLMTIVLAAPGSSTALVGTRITASEDRGIPAATLTVSIEVIQRSPDVTGSVARMREQAERIWESYGVQLAWRAEGARALASDPRRVRLVILDDAPARLPLREPGVADLGWIDFLAPNRPRNVLYLSRRSCLDLLARSALGRRVLNEMPSALRDEYIGRALGRALAHELGHYLLASTGHTPHGLMRERYSIAQLFDIGLHGFDLGIDEVARLRQRIDDVRFGD